MGYAKQKGVLREGTFASEGLEPPIDQLPQRKSANCVLAGGVASNKFIREKFINLCAKKSVQFIVPEQDLCVDNATMVAWAAIERLQINKKGDILDFEPKPRWALEKL